MNSSISIFASNSNITFYPTTLLNFMSACICEKRNMNSIDGEKKLEGEENFILILIFHTETNFTSSIGRAYIALVSL